MKAEATSERETHADSRRNKLGGSCSLSNALVSRVPGYPHVFSFEEYRQLLIIELPASKFFSPPSPDGKTEKPAVR